MKLALLSFEYPPDTGFGGIGTYTWHQARALAKLGHEVHVLAGATEPTGEAHETRTDGVQVWRFRSDNIPMRALGSLGRLRLWWTKNRLENAVSMYLGLKRLQRRHQFDLIEMPECGAEGMLVNRLVDTATLVRFHSPARLIMSCYDVTRADHLLCSWAEQIAINGAGTLTAASRFLADAVRREMGIRAPMPVIPNGIDLEWFDASEQVDARRRFGIPHDKLMIFFAGRMEQRKGIHLCEEIAGSILERHDVAFVFAGQDLFQFMSETLLPSLRRRRLRGSVHYIGKLGLVDVRSCLRQTDIFFMPSLWENCPYSCLEAMAAGRAIVSSDAGGLPELIRDGENGLLARATDPKSYVTALERLIEDNDLRDRLGTAARKTVEASFSDVEIARRSIDVYREALKNGT
jgi:glycosyltransferase involved in cell wall biosynthesis